MDQTEPLIQVRDLHKIFTMGKEKVHALDGVDLDIGKGEMVCLLGPSGSGKSTLLNALAGLERPSKGEIIIGGVHLEKLDEEEVTLFRSLNVGFVFQSYNLIPTLTALENVSLGLILKGVDKKIRDQAAEEILSRVGLGDRLHHRPKELSGGQQQRVAIARAFVGKPVLVFADEPTGNLDTRTSFEVMELMKKLMEENHQTMVMVTHDEEMTVFADRTLHMRDGKIEKVVHHHRPEEYVNVETGPKEDIHE